MKAFVGTILSHLLFSSFAYGQMQQTSHFYLNTQWLCGESIILDSTGLFFQQWGCESDARVAFGNYTISKDGRLRFKFLPLDSIVPISQIDQTGKTKDSIIVVRLFDREGKPVSSSFRIVLLDTAGKFENLWLEENGLIRINRFQYKKLRLD